MVILVNYIFEFYTMYPKWDEIVLVSRATVEIFDKLKDDKGGVVSSIYSWTYSDDTLIRFVHYQLNGSIIAGITDLCRSDYQI